MNRYHIRFNKNRGQPGFGTPEHVWRVFENGEQFIVKHVRINVPVWDEVTGDGQGNDNWNFCCEGYMTVDKESSTVIISATKTD